MKRPAFQFYTGDWRKNPKLRRCSPAARGCWVDLMCIFHESDEYGIVRWPLADLCNAAGISKKNAKELIEKSVLKGDEKQLKNPLIFVPRSGRRNGEPVVLVPAQDGPIWFCSRMVRDEYVRHVRGAGSRFGEDGGADPSEARKLSPNPPLSDGPSSSSSSSTSVINKDILTDVCARPPAEPENEGGAADLLGHQVNGHRGPPECPHIEVLALWAEVMPDQVQHDRERWKGKRADHLRARWRETAVAKGWASQAEGLAYLRKFFGWCRRSPFLMGKVPPRPGNRQFELELAWLVNPENWTKAHEGKYHPEG